MQKKSKYIFLLTFCYFNFICLYGQADDKFVLIPGGKYAIGKKKDLVNPFRIVKTDSFFLAKTETTNSEFEKFVDATLFITDAERLHNAMIFQPGLREFEWMEDSTANWRHPNGVLRGGIENKMDHPVTCISYSDIKAYCKWASVRLPSLDEWEIACRAGTETDYFFGKDVKKIKEYANIWYGKDHLSADSSDGFMYTSPVGSFKSNPFGLYDMYGNVFEFCESDSEKNSIAHARGGSWWCSRNACNFFNSYNIGRANIHASFSNQGFRVVRK